MALVNVLSLSRALTLILCHFSPVHIYVYRDESGEMVAFKKYTGIVGHLN